MQHDLLPLLGLALLLGFKHSYDADHVLAVSNILARSSSLRRTGLLSTTWAVGHMITATLLAVLLYTFRELLLEGLLVHLEVLVAVMLVAIGAFGLLWEFNFLHIHEHWHGLRKHRHVHLHWGRHGDHGAMLSIGIVHGMASNDELLVLLVLSLGITSLGGLLMGIAVFSLGVVAGMVLFGLGLSYPLVRWGSRPVRFGVNVAAAVLSLGYGALLLVWLLSPLPLG